MKAFIQRISSRMLTIVCAYLLVALSTATLAQANHFQWAAKHYAQQNWEAAIQEFDQFIQTSPDHADLAEAVFYRAESYVQLKNFVAAHQAFLDYQRRFPAGRSYKQACFRAAETAYLANDYQTAEPLLLGFLAQFPEDELNRYVIGYLAEIALENRQGEISERYFKQLQSEYGSELNLQDLEYGLGRAYELQGQQDAAITSYHSAAQGSDAELAFKARHKLALLFFLRQDYLQAVENWELVLKNSSDTSQLALAKLGLGRAYYELHKYEQAQNTLQQLNNDSLFQSEANYWIARVRMQAADYQAAVQNFNTALVTIDINNPLLISIEYGLIECYLHLSEPQKTIELIESSRTLQADLASSKLIDDVYLKFIKTSTSSEDRESAIDQLVVILVQRQDWPLLEKVVRDFKADNSDETYSVLLQQAIERQAANHKELYTWWQEFKATTEAPLTTLAGNGDSAAIAVQNTLPVTEDEVMPGDVGSSGSAVLMLTQAYQFEASNQGDKALRLYKQFLQEAEPTGISGTDLQLAYWRGARLAFKLENSELASKLYHRLADRFPESAELDEILYESAWVDQTREDWSQAQQKLLRIHHDFRLSKYWLEASYRLLEIKLRIQEFNEFETILAEVKQHPQANSVLPYLLLIQGQSEAVQQSWDSAVATFTKLLEVPATNASLTATANLLLAEAIFRSHDYATATTLYKKIAQSDLTFYSDERRAHIWLRYAQSLAHTHRWQESQTLVERLKLELPELSNQHEVEYLHGRCYASAGEFEHARKHFHLALQAPKAESSETSAMAQWMIGETYFHQKNYEAAIREYLRLDVLHNYPRWQAASLLQAGKCYEQLNRPQQAAELYRRSITVLPANEFTAVTESRLRNLKGKLNLVQN